MDVESRANLKIMKDRETCKRQPGGVRKSQTEWSDLNKSRRVPFFVIIVTGSNHKVTAFHTAPLCLDEKPEVGESHVPGL